MTVDYENAEIRAAGGVVRRPGPGGEPELAVVHRPRYDDWSFPKGKLDRGESWEQAALREVREETGLRCRLGPELAPVSYDTTKGRKAVRWWLMEPETEPGEFEPNDEVDALRWVSPADAERLLSHDHDRALVREATA
jgi:8-oxo-dGTP pyrophosphatase MutT (NUDIX family)